MERVRPVAPHSRHPVWNKGCRGGTLSVTHNGLRRLLELVAGHPGAETRGALRAAQTRYAAVRTAVARGFLLEADCSEWDDDDDGAESRLFATVKGKAWLLLCDIRMPEDLVE
jgi:hypothetical protein